MKCAICSRWIGQWQEFFRNEGRASFHANSAECRVPEVIVIVRKEEESRNLSYPAGYRREE